jgi:hypothetical protein
MVRFLVGTPLLLIVLVFAGLYAAYGEVDPCRVLAVERARRADLPIPFAGKAIQAWTRMETSQMSTPECTRDLLDSWGERISAHWQR